MNLGVRRCDRVMNHTPWVARQPMSGWPLARWYIVDQAAMIICETRRV